MDNIIVRWYNQNRKIIWTVVLTIVGVIALIQTLNNYYKDNPEDDSSSTNNSTTAYNTNNYSVTTREEINETTSKKSIDLIKDFVDYCNSQEIDSAYKLLSTQCKEELYPTIDDFKTKYYNRIFTEQKTCNSTLWITASTAHTYRIEIMPDLLATGKKDNMPIEEYYTIIYEDGEYKLNISGFIGKEDINISETKNNVTINIISKTIYMDYELYEIQILNNTGSKLIFNTKENLESVYIQDENGLKYIAFLNEIPNSELEILTGVTKALEIKFNRGYKPSIDIIGIVFEDIKSGTDMQKIEIEF